MSEIKNKNYILATIDKLRARKSRPDINRICKFMLKFFKIQPSETKSDLRRCISAKYVYEVDYKDNVSYRNASKLKRGRSRNTKKKMASPKSLKSDKSVISALQKLSYEDQNYFDKGIPFQDLARALAAQNLKFSKKKLEIMVQRELGLGNVVCLPNKNLSLASIDQDNDSTDSLKNNTFNDTADSNSKLTSSANSSGASSPQRPRGRPPGSRSETNLAELQGARVRVGERRKRAKKVFDPSDNVVRGVNKRKRGRPAGSLNKNTMYKRRLLGFSDTNNDRQTESTTRSESQVSDNLSEAETPVDEETVTTNVETQTMTGGGVCSVCLVVRPRGSWERLVSCHDCNNKAHISCLRGGSGILKLRPDNTWQCPHCKTCVVCLETADAGILTVCNLCADAYHALCHTPRIPERQKAWNQWQCRNCLGARPILNPSSPKTPSINSNESPKISNEDTIPHPNPFLSSQEQEQLKDNPWKDVPIDESIPDIRNWSCNDVHKYFLDHFPDAAQIFKEQQMDGQALGLACRSDIVRGLGLPLGPALQLYRIILRLQTRKDDFTMCWG